MTPVENQLQRLNGRTKEATAPLGAAKRLLTTEGTAAIALMAAAKDTLGEFHRWEPESVWLSFERQGITVPLNNWVKLQAALTLSFMPSFYWDGLVFEKTSLAFDGVIPNPATLEEATAAQLAWGVKEAEWIISQDPGNWTRDFEHEPRAYTAVVLHRSGYIVAPTQLVFGQHQLDEMNQYADGDLRHAIREKWVALDKTKMNIHAFTESPVDVQLARLAAVELHVQDREARAATDLAALT